MIKHVLVCEPQPVVYRTCSADSLGRQLALQGLCEVPCARQHQCLRWCGLTPFFQRVQKCHDKTQLSNNKTSTIAIGDVQQLQLLPGKQHQRILRARQERSVSKTWLRRSADSGGVMSAKAGWSFRAHTWCAALPTGQAQFTRVIMTPSNSAPETTKSKPTVQNKVPCLAAVL
jgi:hypothetical protein